MDGVPVKVLAPVELLKRVRRAGPHGKFRLAEEIARAVEAPAPLAAASDVDQPPLPLAASAAGIPRQAESRARLLAHHEILTYDATGSVSGLATNVAQATFELNEIYGPALRFDVAKALVGIYANRWPNVHALTILRAMIGNADEPQDGFRDGQRRDVQIVAKPGATTTFVVICGLRHAFGIQLNILHHYWLAKHNVNVIYLRDFSENNYLTGIESLGGLMRTLGQLRERISRLNTQRLVFVANSAGAFGALYYGALLKADELLLFSGPTSLDVGLQETERQSYARLSELRRAGRVEWPNMREIYEKNGTPVTLYFGSENRVDRLQAENLDGLPNVSLRPIASHQHFILNNLARFGVLDQIFAAAAGTESVPEVWAPATAPEPDLAGSSSDVASEMGAEDQPPAEMF